MDMNPHVNVPLANYFFAALAAEREAYIRDRAYLFLPVLVERPEWQRRGVGRRMLEWGMRMADEEGVACWIDASPEVTALYRRLGWKEIGETKIEFGGCMREVGVRDGLSSTSIFLLHRGRT